MRSGCGKNSVSIKNHFITAAPPYNGLGCSKGYDFLSLEISKGLKTKSDFEVGILCTNEKLV